MRTIWWIPIWQGLGFTKWHYPKNTNMTGFRFKRWLKPPHMSILPYHQWVLSENYPMNTNMTGFRFKNWHYSMNTYMTGFRFKRLWKPRHMGKKPYHLWVPSEDYPWILTWQGFEPFLNKTFYKYICNFGIKPLPEHGHGKHRHIITFIFHFL